MAFPSVACTGADYLSYGGSSGVFYAVLKCLFITFLGCCRMSLYKACSVTLLFSIYLYQAHGP